MGEIKPRVGPLCKSVLSDDFYQKILSESLCLTNCDGCFRALKKKNVGEKNLSLSQNDVIILSSTHHFERNFVT